MPKSTKRVRIAKKPLKVFSTTKKYVGIVSKYVMENEISSMRMSQLEVKNRSASNIMMLIQRDVRSLGLSIN